MVMGSKVYFIIEFNMTCIFRVEGSSPRLPCDKFLMHFKCSPHEIYKMVKYFVHKQIYLRESYCT